MKGAGYKQFEYLVLCISQVIMVSQGPVTFQVKYHNLIMRKRQ